MKYEFLQLSERQAGVKQVTLNRESVHNAFHAPLIQELIHVFSELQSDQDCRLVILTGNGHSFSAGADLNWMKSMVDYDFQQNLEDSRQLAKLFQTIDHLVTPILGLINGPAYGGGTGLISVCDFALCVDSARFGFTETKLGLVPAVISPYVIRKIGESAARAWFLSGDLFNAQQALQMGLVHQVVADTEFEKTGQELIEKFLKAAPLAAKECKVFTKRVVQFLKEPSDFSMQKIEDYTCETIARLRVTPEAQQGMQALLTKKPAPWVKS